MTEPTVPGAAPPPPQAAATPRLVLTGLPPPRPPWRVALRWSLFAALVVVNAGVALLAAAWLHYAHGLPELPSIEGYRPPIVTEAISADGQIAGEFFEERRKVVPYGRIPRTL